jgi:hypothetical protein
MSFENTTKGMPETSEAMPEHLSFVAWKGFSPSRQIWLFVSGYLLFVDSGGPGLSSPD